MNSTNATSGAGRVQRDMGGSPIADKLGWPVEVELLCRRGAKLTPEEIAAVRPLTGLLKITDEYRAHEGQRVQFKMAELSCPHTGMKMGKSLFKAGDPTLDVDGMVIYGYEIHIEEDRHVQFYQAWRVRFVASMRDLEDY